MARCLIIGCGCRGRALAAELCSRGHAVRGTTRKPGQLAAITDAGAEALLADPDRIATIAPAFEHVSLACVLLGSATGSEEQLGALHGTRLEMLLTQMLDTTVRGVVYEAAGTVDEAVLRAGADVVREKCGASLIPYALIEPTVGDHDKWLGAALAAVERVLAG